MGSRRQPGGSYVWTIRDGAVARVCYYQEGQRLEALEAAGLSE